MKELKRCNKCNQVKHIFNFWKDCKSPGKRLNSCSTCITDMRKTASKRPPKEKEDTIKEVYNLNGDTEIYC